MFGQLGIATPLAIAALAVFVVYRQFAQRRVRSWTLVAIPLLALWGGFSLLHGSLPTTPIDEALALLGLTSAVVLGLLRGVATQVWRDAEGNVWARGSALLLGLWVVSFAVRIGLAFLGPQIGAAPEGQGELLLFGAATLGAQNAMLWLRSYGVLEASRRSP